MKIECNLSSHSLKAAAAKLKIYAESLNSKSEKLVKELGEFGEDSAANNLGHYDTGNTLSTLHFIANGTSGTIVVGGAAVWIEFGTGVRRNSGSPHPKAGELGMDAWGTYGDGHGSDPDGWWYPSVDGYSHTYGIKMNQFMWNAAQDMRREVVEIAKEVFAND